MSVDECVINVWMNVNECVWVFMIKMDVCG